MTLFEELFALARGVPLTMVVSADEVDGRMTIAICPQVTEDKGVHALRQPLSLIATPQEFDAGFLDALRGYREVRSSLAEQADATREVLEAAKAASVKKASEATSKAATPTPKSTTAASGTSPAEPVAAGASAEPTPASGSNEPQALDLFG